MNYTYFALFAIPQCVYGFALLSQTFISAPCFQHESAKKALAPISAEQCVDKTVPEYNTHHLVPRSDNRWRGCGAALLNCNPVVIVTAAHCVDVRRRHISDILC